MKQILTLVFIIFVSTNCLFSQVNIQIRVRQTHTKLAKLYFYSKTELVIVDSTYKVSSEVFKFSLPAGFKQGLYKLALGKNISFDFVVASEHQISLETIIFAAQDSLKSLVSVENDVYIKYCKIRKVYNQQLYLLNSLTNYYSDSSSFTKPLSTEIDKVNNDLYFAMKKLANDNPGLYSSNLILLEIKPNPINILSKKERLNNIKYWWTDANLSDARLVNSPLLDQKLWEYFELFFDDSFDKEQQDSSFIATVNTLMNIKADSSIRLYFRNFLFKSLLETDYDAAIRFLYKTQFDGIPPLKLTLEEQNVYSSINSIEVGTKAADFKVTSLDGKNQKISKITSPIKLLIFYSMYCPHCTEMMPQLLKVYHSYKDQGFEVVAISIDEDVDIWRKYIADNRFTWINAIEPDNGKSKILPEFNVTGTPELFLIDSKQLILSRPSNVKQLEAKLKKILK